VCRGAGSAIKGWRPEGSGRKTDEPNTSCICGGKLSDNLLAGYSLILQAVRDRGIGSGLHDEVYTVAADPRLLLSEHAYGFRDPCNSES